MVPPKKRGSRSWFGSRVSRDSLINDPAVQKVDRACPRPGQTRSAGYYYTGVDSNSYARASFPRATLVRHDTLSYPVKIRPYPFLLLPSKRDRNPKGIREIVDLFGEWNGYLLWPVNWISIVGNRRECPRAAISNWRKETIENRRGIFFFFAPHFFPFLYFFPLSLYLFLCFSGETVSWKLENAREKASCVSADAGAGNSINIYSRDQDVHKYLFEHRELL